MKLFLTLLLLIVLSNCSFDNKTGIWKNAGETEIKKEDKFKDFKTIYSAEKSFDSIVIPTNETVILIDSIKENTNWTEEFYQNTNNLDNFIFKDLNDLVFKSKKLSRNKVKEKILFDGDNIIFADIKGKIIVYSVNQEKIIYRYNFYKKKYKKLKKNLNILVENNVLYVADNFGFLYALDYLQNKLLWAINYKIPFRSNLKISGNKIIISDQNNSLYLINKLDGTKIKILPTEETTLKNNFVNSLALDNNSTYFLNTYGSLYSLNNKNFKINWFINLNQSLDLNPANLFYSNPITIYKDIIIVSSNPNLYILNKINGSINHKIVISSIIQPIVSGQNLFLVTENNLLVCININTGKIIYSLSIEQEIAKFLETKKKSVNIRSLFLVNNDLFLYLNNSYLIKFRKNGKIYEVVKPKAKINTLPIFINGSILYLNKNNRLIILD